MKEIKTKTIAWKGVVIMLGGKELQGVKPLLYRNNKKSKHHHRRCSTGAK